jgi:hypothetical protein
MKLELEQFGESCLNRHWKLIAASILATTTLVLVACTAHPSIAEINRDPGKYSDKDIKVSGHVSNGFAAFGTGVYQIDDGTGTMWVYSQNGVPINGTQVSVVGRVQQGFSIGGRSYATILHDTEQRR